MQNTTCEGDENGLASHATMRHRTKTENIVRTASAAVPDDAMESAASAPIVRTVGWAVGEGMGYPVTLSLGF